MQTVIAILLLIGAGVFLSWKFIGKKLVKSKDDGGSCGPDCNCS